MAMSATEREELEQRALEGCIAPQEAAAAAGLVYVSAGEPGIRRVPEGEGFRYLGPEGRPLLARPM